MKEIQPPIRWRAGNTRNESRLLLMSSILRLAVNADKVIGERRVERLAAKRRHVAADTPTPGVDGTRAPRSWVRGSSRVPGSTRRHRGCRMTVQTLGRGACRLELVVAMRIMAGRAVKGAAFRVTAAPGKGRRLKANPERIGARQRRFRVIGVALAAKPKPSFRVSALGFVIARSRNLSSSALT